MFEFISVYFKTWSTHMDYEGQKVAERIFQIVIVLFGVVGFIVGYLSQQGPSLLNYVTQFDTCEGFLISCLLVLPPWPFLYRQHPLNWLKPVPKSEEGSGSNSSQKKKKK